jgi:hypothetical protein
MPTGVLVYAQRLIDEQQLRHTSSGRDCFLFGNLHTTPGAEGEIW